MKCYNLLLIFISLYFVSCNNKSEKVINTTQTESDSLIAVNALYFNSNYQSKAMYKWDMIKLDIPSFKNGKNSGVLDATIEKPETIYEIQKLVESLETDSSKLDFLPDYRIAVTLQYKNGKIERLGISHPPKLDLIFLNDIPQKTNNRLLYVIKNNIGLYSWLIGDALYEQPELQDNSFMKEPFIQSKYNK